MNTIDLQLKCGNPQTIDTTDKTIDNPASFSRFVFPFAYRLQKVEIQPQALCYQHKPNNDISCQRRKKYLTNETALVLFERAKWFEITKEAWQNTPWETNPITVILKTGDFQIKMLPPALVLFEFASNKETTENIVLQTGFLYVDMYFPEQTPSPAFDDLLLFNEFFRHFDIPDEKHVARYKKCLKNIPIDYPIDNNRYRKLDNADTDNQASYFVRWFNLLEIPINYGGQNYALIPNPWMEVAKEWIYRTEIQKSYSDGENCLVHVDNRCYVWSAAFINEGGNALNKAFNNPLSEDLRAHHFGHWVKLLNIDPPDDTAQQTHKAISDFEKKWAKARTYKRWEHQGTWYGYNHHSGVMLADPTRPDLSYLCRVFREQYFDQTILLLYLRTTLFRFSRKLSLIIHEQKQQQPKDKNEWLKQIRQIRREFSRFAILYQFPSLSNQQQAIEMYTLARYCLDIDELYREVQEEIANTHDFLEQAETNKLSSAANLLARWGVPIAATSVVASLFGMNEYNFLITCTKNCLWSTIGIPITLALLVGAIAWFISKKIITKERDQ